jgi:hypothetical protein
MDTAYRVHVADESPDTALDPCRNDGWVASDELRETQPYGVSACLSLRDLARYIRDFGMAVADGDLLLRLSCDEVHDTDRDPGAVRVVASSWDVVATGKELRDALALLPEVADLDDGMDLLASGEYASSEEMYLDIFGRVPTETALALAREMA